VLLTTIMQAIYLIVFCWFLSHDTTVVYANPFRLCPRELKK